MNIEQLQPIQKGVGACDAETIFTDRELKLGPEVVINFPDSVKVWSSIQLDSIQKELYQP